MFTKKLIPFLLIFLSVMLSGCISVKTGSESSSTQGGFFKSINQGTSWEQKSLVPSTSGEPKSFASVDVLSLVMDPSDNKAIYFGSLNNGMFYTYDGGETWQIAKSLGQVSITAIAVDPDDKCTIYVATGNKIYKSIDCSRSWDQIYYDNNEQVYITDISIDHYDGKIVYAGISRGDIIQSNNAGEGWRTILRAEGEIKKIAIDPSDSRIVYAATDKKGIFKTVDKGENWEKLDEFSNALKENKLNAEVMDMVLVKETKDLIYVATYYGLLKSTDGGATWEKLELIPPEREVKINKLAVNTQNSQQIYYVTSTTFYRSIDGGVSWTTIQLPTSRAGWELLLDEDDANIIYLGVRDLSR